ncbi:MAG TPA: hypothetical protein VKZ71_09615 [Burkholderiaceae bacterium]|nr:hypothetical protein [Burkholderiaceae bacterium]
MSWRLMFVVLLVAAGLSAWGGITLGHWLVAHGPETPPLPEELFGADIEVLDADGRPYTAQAPQPLIDGRLGIPDPVEPIEWQIADTSLAEEANLPIAVATTKITPEEARRIAHADDEFRGLADVGDLIGALQGGQQIQPIDVPPPPPAPAPAATAEADRDWQLSLRREIQACEHVGFFQRPSCAWTARNKYCGPRNAWGKTPDCPSRSF